MAPRVWKAGTASGRENPIAATPLHELHAGNQFTFFPSTKVQILTQSECKCRYAARTPKKIGGVGGDCTSFTTDTVLNLLLTPLLAEPACADSSCAPHCLRCQCLYFCTSTARVKFCTFVLVKASKLSTFAESSSLLSQVQTHLLY